MPDEMPEENTTMQQAIYNSTSIRNTNQTTGTSALQATGVRRWVARSWDLVGVVALMGSSAAYGVFALAHVGL